MLKESDDLVILGVTLASKVTSEKHLRSVSRAASQSLAILKKSWRIFHVRSLLGSCFLCFVLPVLEYCSVVWCSAADTHLKLLDRVVSGDRFLTEGVFECDIAHRQFVAVLCKLYTISAGYTRCSGRTSVYLCSSVRQNLAVAENLYSPAVSLLTDLADPVFDVEGLAGFKWRVNPCSFA